jgi:hypothetical protein
MYMLKTSEKAVALHGSPRLPERRKMMQAWADWLDRLKE